MEQQIEDFREVVEERNYAQDMYIEASRELDKQMDEVIAVKKERNELRERLKSNKRENWLTLTFGLNWLRVQKPNQKLVTLKKIMKKERKI